MPHKRPATAKRNAPFSRIRPAEAAGCPSCSSRSSRPKAQAVQVDRGGADVQLEVAVRVGCEDRGCQTGAAEADGPAVRAASGAREADVVEQCRLTAGALTFRWKSPFERTARVKVARAA